MIFLNLKKNTHTFKQTYTGSILVAVNPYKEIDCYTLVSGKMPTKRDKQFIHTMNSSKLKDQTLTHTHVDRVIIVLLINRTMYLNIMAKNWAFWSRMYLHWQRRPIGICSTVIEINRALYQANRVREKQKPPNLFYNICVR